MGRKKGANQVLIGGSAYAAAEQGTSDRDPPVILRRGERGRSPTSEKAKDPWAKIARRVESPSLQIAHRGSNQRYQQADHQGARIPLGRHLVVLLGDGEDAKDEKRRQYDLVAE